MYFGIYWGVGKIEKSEAAFKEAPVGKAEEVKDSNTSDGVDWTITSQSDSEGGLPWRNKRSFALAKKLLMVKQLKMTLIGST